MDIKVKEPLYVNFQGQEYVVRPGTTGIQRNNVVFFADVTRTTAIGFPKDHCINDPLLFSVGRTISDKEVSLRDVLKVLHASGVDAEKLSELEFKLNSL